MVIATERARRPEDFAHERRRRRLPERSSSCPFCPGSEAQCGETLYAAGDPWRVRVVNNKFPALTPRAALSGRAPGLYRRLPGLGTHEVIIETPSHARHLALQPREAVRDVFLAYRERFRASSRDSAVAMTVVFKNHGPAAGTSLEHPHSQLIGSSVLPAHIRHRMDVARRYRRSRGSCVYCDMRRAELRAGARILADTAHFTAFVLFAALSPFHIWVLPKRHTPGFGAATDAELADLAGLMRVLLGKLNRGLDDPDYNFLIQSAPQERGAGTALHWYLSLVVRVSQTAGFELGSGMFINTALPEESARFLNAIPPGRLT